MNTQNLLRVLGIGAGTVALAGVVWFSLRGTGEVAVERPSSTVVRPGAVANPAQPSPPTATPPTASVRVGVPAGEAAGGVAIVEIPSGDEEAAAAAEPAADEGVAAIPAYVPTPAPPPEPSANVDLALDQREPDGPGGTVGEPVVVPSSYPVSEAARYFVPREERRPGNLGGPPPLDFPGGPNDPAGGGFAPPPAPGG